MLGTKKNRIWEIDFLRGFAILLVVFDHACFDFGQLFYEWRYCGNAFLETIFHYANGYLFGDLRLFWRSAFLFLFFFLSGTCTSFSKNNFLRGLKLWAVALLVSFVTKIIDVTSGSDSSFVLLGVLHCLALIILLYAIVDGILTGSLLAVKKIRKKENPAWLEMLVKSVFFAAIAAVGLFLQQKYNVRLRDVSGEYAVSGVDGWLGFLFYTRAWWTADYFPLIPFVSFFFLGAVFGKTVYRKKKTLLPLLEGVWHAPVTFAGRHSLFVYLGGQVFCILLGVTLSAICLGNPLLF